jgi:hypothetical protein
MSWSEITWHIWNAFYTLFSAFCAGYFLGNLGALERVYRWFRKKGDA